MREDGAASIGINNRGRGAPASIWFGMSGFFFAVVVSSRVESIEGVRDRNAPGHRPGQRSQRGPRVTRSGRFAAQPRTWARIGRWNVILMGRGASL